MSTTETTYRSVGVDTQTEELGLKLLTEQIKRTWPTAGIGAVKLDIGAFANVIDLGAGLGLAISADGVGSKVIIAQMMENYSTVGIDCVAMNVNDILCVGAKPLSMVDYIAIEEAAPKVLAEIAMGLTEGAKRANVSIPGGEIAQLPDVLRSHKPGLAFDLAGMAVGLVPTDRILVGRDIQPGDAIIGVASSGIHSNGLTLARRVLFETAGLNVRSNAAPLECSLGEELLKPTHIYVREAVELLEMGVPVRAYVHITSDGFLNLPRVEAAEVGFVLDALLPIPPIFSLIQEHGQVSDEEMFLVYNMGVGFCMIVDPAAAEAVLSVVKRHGKEAGVIGHVIRDSERGVHIPQKGLKGVGKEFARV
ncbi:Phosphoribosylformylglycinamidine cyclo-ligase [Candidatus Sulfopaludibacter sp. SbA4]|nr:Phosphoribosylformylglycinamidine cyclo-ligase [Candidatus Sulfopaludibacter sp. SbA4]